MEKELFGLRDKDGNEYKVVTSLDPFGNGLLIQSILLADKTKPLPEFKVGQWIIGINNYNPYIPALITRLDGNKDGWYDDFINGVRYNNLYKSSMSEAYCRHATPQEIGAHLRKICDEKYKGKRAKCLLDGKEYLVDDFWEYRDYQDRICYHTIDAEGDGIWLYEKGKFAEIIPAKKKLPKTSEEFFEFMDNYDEYKKKIKDKVWSYSMFLDQYDYED